MQGLGPGPDLTLVFNFLISIGYFFSFLWEYLELSNNTFLCVFLLSKIK